MLLVDGGYDCSCACRVCKEARIGQAVKGIGVAGCGPYDSSQRKSRLGADRLHRGTVSVLGGRKRRGCRRELDASPERDIPH